jgi:hypothetical protein
MPKCHICGKASNYSQMVDYNLYSVHPKCEEKKKKEDDNNNNKSILANSKLSYDYKKGLYSCPICKTNNNKDLSKLELRKHLENQHTKEGLIDRILLDSFKTSK